MAEAVPPRQAPDTSPQPRRSHGKKRAADGHLESDQRLSKRFDLLNLDNGTRLYLPVASSSEAALTPDPCARQPARPVPVPAAKKSERPRRRPLPDDCMHVEDTPHRVYIADLDAELSDIESDEDNPIFLQDIEKHLAKIPKHVLMRPEPKATKDNQLIVYTVPSSLTVPEEQDSVRKAIVEARGRIRDRQAGGVGSGSRSRSSIMEPGPAHPAALATEIPPPSVDSDAMDID